MSALFVYVPDLTDVHLATAMTEQHLLDFIKRKLSSSPDEIVMEENGEKISLSQVFEMLGLDPARLSVHSLEANKSTQPHSKFRTSHGTRSNPYLCSELDSIFLSVDNYNQGKYFAEIAKEVFATLEESKKCAEMRIAIYGRSAEEWERLAAWVDRFDVRSARNRWLIELPRDYHILREEQKDPSAKSNNVQSFQDYLDNVFGPLYAATEHPEEHPQLAAFLESVSGFDTVDDESRHDPRMDRQLPPPILWTSDTNPAFAYYMYHYYACIARLNKLRASKGKDPLSFRPHCGEFGSENHLVAGFLLATNINHGLNLVKLPVLQYLYYLCYVGITMTPLSNNRLLTNYNANPFPLFFRRGLLVSLSTDDPLQYHYTQKPLSEEYAIASRFWNLAEVDLAELCKNSVFNCGFPREQKEKWYGKLGVIPGTTCNDVHLTGVPLIRTHFRSHCFEAEVRLLFELADEFYDSGSDKINTCTTLKYPQCSVILFGRSSLATPMLPPAAGGVAQAGKQMSLLSVSAGLCFKSGTSDYEDQSLFTGIHIHNSLLQLKDPTNSEIGCARPLVLEAISLRNKYAVTWFDRNSAERSRPRPRRDENKSYMKQLADNRSNELNKPSMMGDFSRHAFQKRNGVFIVYDSHEVFCANDGEEMATVYCTVCGQDYCAECFAVLHQSPSKRTHKKIEHPPSLPLYSPIGYQEFAADYRRLCAICTSGPVCTMCWHRNHMLEERFNFHVLLNQELEENGIKHSGTDFYRAVKVDNHIHANRSMSSESLLEFIEKSLKEKPDDVVLRQYHGESNVTLVQLFRKLGLNPNHLTLNQLGTRGGAQTFRRFDLWIHKCEPFGQQVLKDLFLGTFRNEVGGRYLGDLLHETTYAMLDRNRSIRLELRVSVCGGRDDVARVARWVTTSKLLRHPSNRWMIQVPRIYPDMYARGAVHSFGEFLSNIFRPLFEVTKDPSTDRAVHEFLQDVSGFDCVGDEHLPETTAIESLPLPDDWTTGEQPPYAYYMYYLNANIQSLNNFRLLTGRNIFDFRPHCGETGDVLHLAVGYLTAKQITHGTQLKDNPALSYLYYINQIGISTSPLSETAVHVLVKDNPFPVFFRRGLNVSLSTDNPLMIHMTDEPIVEEYATAAQMWNLSTTDLCEIARNSVLQSGFTMAEKEEWLGKGFAKVDLSEHDIGRTNLPLVRLRFRYDAYFDELKFLQNHEVPVEPQAL